MTNPETIKNVSTADLENIARHMYNHCPRIKRLHKEWASDLEAIHKELNTRKEVSK